MRLPMIFLTITRTIRRLLAPTTNIARRLAARRATRRCRFLRPSLLTVISRRPELLFLLLKLAIGSLSNVMTDKRAASVLRALPVGFLPAFLAKKGRGDVHRTPTNRNVTHRLFVLLRS